MSSHTLVKRSLDAKRTLSWRIAPTNDEATSTYNKRRIVPAIACQPQLQHPTRCLHKPKHNMQLAIQSPLTSSSPPPAAAAAAAERLIVSSARFIHRILPEASFIDPLPARRSGGNASRQLGLDLAAVVFDTTNASGKTIRIEPTRSETI